MKVHLQNVDTKEREWVEMPDLSPDAIHLGDYFTISGVHKMVSNPARRWWQLWKPRLVKGPLQTFRCTGQYNAR